MPKNILIVSGEPSGDLHASNLVKELKKLDKELSFFGLGGSLSKDAGVSVDFDMTRLAIVGLVDAWKNIFTVGSVFRRVLKKVDSSGCDLAILVDYPGFNLRLAKELKKRGVRVIYYISPQVWAWGEDRIGIIKKCVEKILVFFRFEEDLYRRRGVNVEFVGHPLAETVRPSMRRDDVMKKYALLASAPLIALLPGSRKAEVASLLKTMARAARLIRAGLPDAQFAVAKHRSLPASLYEDAIKRCGVDIKICESDAYNILGAADSAIVASGTATLETAIIGTPFIITYRANFVNYIAYLIVAKKRVLGLVNWIAQSIVVPELLQYDATPSKLAAATLGLLRDSARRSDMLAALKRVRESLGPPGASARAARAILPYVQ